MNRSDILKTAEEYVSQDRNLQYGEPEDNFATIAEYWAVYLGDRSEVLDAFDVASMMVLFKMARMSKRPPSADSAVDLAGYAACAGEILERSIVDLDLDAILGELKAQERGEEPEPPQPDREDTPSSRYDPKTHGVSKYRPRARGIPTGDRRVL